MSIEVRRAGVCLLAIVGLLASLLAWSPPPAGSAVRSVADDDGGKLAPGLAQRFERSSRPQDFWISFSDAADTSAAREIDDWAERGRQVVDRLRAVADAAQAETRALLDAAGADYTAYWITNAIRVHGGDAELASLVAAQPEVESVFAPVRYEQPEPVETRTTAKRLGVDAVASAEWGIQNIKADQVWEQYGVRGDGIVVANIDTGVQFDHPALVETYRGNNGDGTFTHDYNWFDAAGVGSDFPADDEGHGTHTMGTMVGDDGGANQIGVAPGATWIAANGCCPSDEALIASAQWMLAPTRIDGADPDPAMRPHVVNNSWASKQPSTDPFIEDVLTAWADAGIFGVWANGNLGSGCGTAASPGSRILNYSVGAYSANNTITGFSSRGPGQDGEIKPNISAPGDDVRSAIPTNGYAAYDGTSMATPHVAGAIALLWSAEPSLIGDLATTRQLLDDTAIDSEDTSCGGTADDNNVYGEGRLDALALVEAATGPAELGTITGTITDDETGDPVSGARLILVAGELRRSTRTGGDGGYLANIPVGDYTATVTAFGYEPSTIELTVTAGQTTTTDVQLTPVEGHALTGRVVDKRTGRPLVGVAVNVASSRFFGTTDADGRFTVSGVPGPSAYTVVFDGGPCARAASRSIHVGDRDVNIGTIRLARRVDQPISRFGKPYGYGCRHEPRTWIRADQPLPLPDDVMGTIKTRLPFAFPYFGRAYRMLYVQPSGTLGFRQPDTPGPRIKNFSLHLLSYGAIKFAPESKILTRTTGRKPNRVFTVEYRDMSSVANPAARMSFEIRLREDGDIVYAYRSIDPGDLAGSRTSIAIEAPEYEGRSFDGQSFNVLRYEAGPPDAWQIRFDLPATGFITGRVVDAKTGASIAGATVDVFNPYGRRVMRTTTGAEGRYVVQVRAGRAYDVVIRKPRGYPAGRRERVRVTTDGQRVRFAPRLRSGRLRPSVSAVTVPASGTASFVLSNPGGVKLSWWAGREVRRGAPPAPGTELASAALSTSTVPMGIAERDGNWWISGVDVTRPNAPGVIREVHPSGTATGEEIDVAALAARLGVEAGALVPGDITSVPSGDWLCAAFFAGSNDIGCADPDGHIQVIRTGIADPLKVSGVAYDVRRDLFYVAVTADGNGVEEVRILTLAGFEHPEPGARLNRCDLARQSNGGLAYNPTSRSLWTLTTRSRPARLVTVLQEFHPASCAELGHLVVTTTGGNLTNGLAVDRRGDFLGVSTIASTVARLRTPDPVDQRVGWLRVSKLSGTVGPKKSQRIRITVDRSAIPAGVTGVRLVLRGNAGPRPKRVLPIRLR